MNPQHTVRQLDQEMLAPAAQATIGCSQRRKVHVLAAAAGVRDGAAGETRGLLRAK
jgi:hypothetical protein